MVIMCYLVQCFVFCFLVAAARAGSIQDEEGKLNSVNVSTKPIYTEDAIVKKLGIKCSSSDVYSCLMLKTITYFNRLLQKTQIEMGDFEITQTSAKPETEEGTTRSFSESLSDEGQFLQVLADKAWKFMKSRSLKWKVTEDTEIILSGNSDEEGSFNMGLSIHPIRSENGDARRRRRNNGLALLLAAAAMKVSLLKALALKTLALLVGKALLVSKLALVLAAIIGLKKLFSQDGGKHVTYEVVAHPQHETHHEHSYSSGGGGGGHEYGSWGRNYKIGNELAYKAYKP